MIQKDSQYLNIEEQILNDEKTFEEKSYLEKQNQQQIEAILDEKKTFKLESNVFKRNGRIFSQDFQFQEHTGENKKMSLSQEQLDEQTQIGQKSPQKLLKSINLLVNVKSFYRLLTKNTRILGKLTKDQHYLINDISSVFKKNRNSKVKKINTCHFLKVKKSIQLINNLIRNIINSIPMFQPYNLYKFLWDILQAILILSVIFLFSLVTFFQMDITSYIEFFQFIFIIFVLDILFTFNTGLVEKGNVIFDRKKAAIVYLKKYFIMDLIALLPLFTFVLNLELHGLYSWVIYFQILFKLFVLSDTFSRLTYYLSYQKNLKNIVDLVKLVFIIACVCHFFCLFWHGLAIYEINLGFTNTWLQMRKIEEEEVFTRYVQSFYYLAVTMITVGYGDITPQTTYEILFTTITMFVTGFFYAFSLNKIGSIIENIEMKDKSYKENMQVIHRLMREENVSQTLRVQISNYLKYLYKLKYDLTQDIQGKYLKDIEFIDKLETKSKIVEIMEECLFSPGEYIFKQGDIDDCSLYYIVKGSVKITFEYQLKDQTESLVISHLKKCQYFGDMQFIQGNCRILTAQASDFCRTYKIPREQFFKCIKQSDQDFENFQMLKEAYVFKDNLKLFKIKCYTCNKSDHTSIKCPKTHLTLSKQTLIQKENKSTPHLQREYKKRSQQKFNCVYNNLEVLYGIYQFIDQVENQEELQILEEQMHLSQDEAYIEQQQFEQERQEQQDQLRINEYDSGMISEEDEQTSMISQEYNSQSNNYYQNSFENQSNFSGNHSNKIYSNVDGGYCLFEQNQSSNNHKEYILNQNLRTNQQSFEKIQSSNNLIDQFNSNDKQYCIEKEFTIEKNTQQSIPSSIQINKQKDQSVLSNEQSEVQENIPSQIQNCQTRNGDRNIQNQEYIKLDFQHRAEKDIQNNCIENQKIMICNQQSEDSLSQESSPHSNCQNQKTIKEEKVQKFQKRKFSSLTNLNEHFLIQQKNNQQAQINLSRNNSQLQKKQQQNNKSVVNNNEQNSANQQFLRSQTYDERTSSVKGNQVQSKGRKKQPQKILEYIKANNTFNKTINESVLGKQLLEENILKQNSTLINANHSKQNAIYNSQNSQIMALNHEMAQRRDQIIQQKQEMNRTKSQKVKILRQYQLQKGSSQLSSSNIQDNQLYKQNTVSKNQHNLLSQNSLIQIYQDNPQDNLLNKQSVVKIQNKNNLNPSLVHFISQQINNSPLIQKRRQNMSFKNMLSQISQEFAKKRNSTSMVFDHKESSKTQLEILKKKPSLLSESNMKESSKKQLIIGSKFELSQQIVNNSHLQNHLLTPQNQYMQQQSNANGQEVYIYKQVEDSSYLMLQLFDKPNIFKYYYPMQNINVVISNLKQNDNKQKNQQSLRKQVTMNIIQNKKKLKQIIKKDNVFDKNKLNDLLTLIN